VGAIVALRSKGTLLGIEQHYQWLVPIWDVNANLPGNALSEIRRCIDKVLIAAFELEVSRSVFKLVRRTAKSPRVDLETVRETLLYMESDCRNCAGLEAVAAALEHAITEIDRAASLTEDTQPREVVAAKFIPAGLS
jgi:hypothetical protein